jgi:tripartite-type tricarboxylate transporter receptor subunit TctC
MMTSIRLAVIAFVFAAAAAPASSQPSYPDRTIRLLYGFAPGTDTVARLLADKLGEALAKPVIVENVTGAGGNIAADRTAKAAADGYTIGVLANGNLTVNATLYKKLPYDPAKDLAPITQVYGYPNVLAVNNDVPAKSVAELVALARAAPGTLTFGSSGAGTSLHLSGELFKIMAHVDVQHVPFRGSSLVVADLMGGRITMSFLPPVSSLALLREGKITPLAVTSLTRAPFLPDVPTMEESGFPGFSVTAWFGMFVPAGTPEAVIQRLHAETTRITASPDFRDKLEAIGISPMASPPAELAHTIKTETAYWAKVIEDAGIMRID